MTLFGLFGNKKSADTAIPFQLVTDNPEPSSEEVTNEIPCMEENSSDSKSLTVSYATGWPIDIIYGYLHKNYENKGYEDAMLNSNLTFRDMNMNIIRHKILMVFREINLNYDAMKQDIDTRIDTCHAAGLLTTAAELNKRLAVINAHKDELSRLENDFRNKSEEASVPLMSYECGFLRGISTIAMADSSKTQAMRMPAVPTFDAKSMAV